jgi:hypothetical protein
VEESLAVLLQQGVPHGRRVLIPVFVRHSEQKRVHRLEREARSLVSTRVFYTHTHGQGCDDLQDAAFLEEQERRYGRLIDGVQQVERNHLRIESPELKSPR